MSGPASRENGWPSLPLDAWQDTYATLHLWMQIVGKIRLTQSPWFNHSWHATFYVTASGLTTSCIPYRGRTFQIDFDFLSETQAIAAGPIAQDNFDLGVLDSPPVVEAAPIHKDDAAMPEIPSIGAMANEPHPAPKDFDLTGITLDLNPADGNGALNQNAYGVHDTAEAEDYSGSAEMATKLDLAVAYQEIGDREGARELLDEVVKGGTAEQTEKAKSLIQKFG